MAAEQKIVECESCHARMTIPPGYERVEGKCPKCGGVVNRQKVTSAPRAAGQAGMPAQAVPGGVDLGLERPAFSGQGQGPDGTAGLGGASVDLNLDLGLDQSPFTGAEQGPAPDGSPGLGDMGLDLNIDLGLDQSPFAVSGKEAAAKKEQKAQAEKLAWKERFSPRRILRFPWRDLAVAVLIWGPAGAMILGTAVSIIGMIIGALFSETVAFLEDFDGVKFGMFFGIPTGLCFGVLWGIIRTLRLSSLAGFFLGAFLGAVVTIIHQTLETILIAPPDAPILLSALVGGAAAGTFAMIAGMFTTADDD